MRLQLQLTFAGGDDKVVTAIVADFIAWEKYAKRKISDLANGAGVTDMAYLAYSAIKRENPKTPDFDTWVETIESIEAVESNDPKATKKAR